MNNKLSNLSIAERHELTNAACNFWKRVGQGIMPGVVYPDHRLGVIVKFEGYGFKHNERLYTFTLLSNKVQFMLLFTVDANPELISDVKVVFNKLHLDAMRVIMIVDAVMQPEVYYIGGTGQKVVDGVSEPIMDTLKRTVCEFLDKAPFVSITNFDALHKRFQSGDSYIVSISRFQNVLKLAVYDKHSSDLLAKIVYQHGHLFTCEIIRTRIDIVDLIKVFNFRESSVSPLFNDPGINPIDTKPWVERFTDLLKTTDNNFSGGQVLWEDAVFVINHDETVTTGYIRAVGSTDLLELTIRHVGEKSHNHDGKVIIQYDMRLNAVTRLDRNNDNLLAVAGYFINNYLRNTPPVAKKEPVQVESDDITIAMPEPSLLNNAGDDINEQWIVWYVREYKSNMADAIKASLHKASQIRNQYDAVIDKYEK